MQRPPRSLTHEEQARRLHFSACLVLVPVAGLGAVLSFRSLYDAASSIFGERYATGFPLLVDLLILGASQQYVAGAKVGQPMPGWRITAHAGVAATLVLNAMAAEHLREIPWHIAAPAVWAILVELTAKQVLGEWKTDHGARPVSIPASLWFTAPVESLRTKLLMLRTGIGDAALARNAVGVHAAAREALRLALPDGHGRRVRKIINRQLRAGSLPPTAILVPLGWCAAPTQVDGDARPETILRAVLKGVLDPVSQTPRSPESTTQASATAEVTRQAEAADQEIPHLNLSGREIKDVDAARSHRSTSKQNIEQQLRLDQAVDIVRRRPDITGREMRAALENRGWKVSNRTASRLLPAARQRVVLQPGSMVDH
jgi:hypothetical protein